LARDIFENTDGLADQPEMYPLGQKRSGK